jgi:hypothetical protein
MRRAQASAATFVVALAASWLLLLLWAADVDWHAPLAPSVERSFPGSDFRPVFGTGGAQGDQFRAAAAAEDFSALQSVAIADAAAEDFSTLRYRFAGFPRTLELSLVFRTAEHPDDVQTISLPWPGSGVSSFDLSGIAAWKGTIIELGFAEFATAQVVPPRLGFRPFNLIDAELWSPSWRGDLAALTTDWFGAWPWSQRSVHALGREGEATRARSPVLVAALAVGIATVWSMLLLGLRSRRLLGVVLVCTAVAWLFLDMRWQIGLVQRLLATRTLYADVAWPETARIVGDSEILDAAVELKAALRDEPAQTRILVQAGSGYQLLRMIWHLLPLNVGAFAYAAQAGVALPEGSVIVFYSSDAWYRSAAMRTLLAHSQRIAIADAVLTNGFDGSRLVVFRYHHAH